MKLLILTILILLSITGCQDSPYKNKEHVSIMGGSGVNPNSLAYKSANDNQERKNKIEISKIDSNTKIEIAKIKSSNELLIAKVNAKAKTEVAKTDAVAKVQTTQIDALTKKDDIQNQLYITISIIIVAFFALVLLFLNNKKNRELKSKLHQEQLMHEQRLKDREHDERRLHKILELVEKGKLPSDMERDILASLAKPSSTLIESK